MTGEGDKLNSCVEDRKPKTVSPISFDLRSKASARGVIITDTDYRIISTDAQISSLFNLKPEELLGKDMREVASSIKSKFKEPDEFETRLLELYSKTHKTAEDVMTLPGEPERVLHRYSAPLLDGNNKLVGRIDVYSDITKRRNLERTNTILYENMCSAFDELKEAQEQLVQSERLRAVGEIASGVAHDFNNTLGIILGNIQLLMRAVKDDKLSARLKSIEQAALDGAETVRRIQEFARIEQRQQANTIDLSALTADLVNAITPSWGKSPSISVKLDLGKEIFALGVAAQIREVLANVLQNAVQSMPQGGIIRVSTGRTKSNAWVKVEDSGVGMSEDIRKKVFDPFFTTKASGTGLGMSVAYGIVKRHKGKITIESLPGKGSIVSIYLPASDKFAETNADDQPDRDPKPIPASILVVDDEEMFADVFFDMLSECGHAVCVARNGHDAIQQFKNNKFDLVFTDLGMPEMSGWQVAKEIKNIQPTTPVVLLTGWGADLDKEKLAESKVDIILSKPVKIEELSAAITQIMTTAEKSENK